MRSRYYDIDVQLMRIRTRKRRRRFLIGSALFLLVVWLVAYLVLGITVISGSSMRPAYVSGDVLLYLRGTPGELEYGDVVIVRTQKESMIKRVAGKPGDVIELDERGHLTRNGEAVSESEVIFGLSAANNNLEYPFKVPEDEYFVLGDNRPLSLDSRTLGSIPRAHISGRVLLVLRSPL